MFSFNNQDQAFKTKLKEGVCEFVIVSAADRDFQDKPYLSKKGVPMLKLKMTIRDAVGQTEDVTTHLLASYAPKFKELCYAVGKPEWFDAALLQPRALEGLSGRCKVEHSFYGERVNANVTNFLYNVPEVSHGIVDEDDCPL